MNLSQTSKVPKIMARVTFTWGVEAIISGTSEGRTEQHAAFCCLRLKVTRPTAERIVCLFVVGGGGVVVPSATACSGAAIGRQEAKGTTFGALYSDGAGVLHKTRKMPRNCGVSHHLHNLYFWQVCPPLQRVMKLAMGTVSGKPRNMLLVTASCLG